MSLKKNTQPFLFPPRPQPFLPIQGRRAVYPVARVFCVGRNFADHAAEMGAEIDRDAPFYFTKSCHHVRLATGQVPLAANTKRYDHELELVVALGSGGKDIGLDQAMDHVLAYGLGLDMTRRDLQQGAKDRRRPWDTAKDVEASALVGTLRHAGEVGDLSTASLSLWVQGELRQQSTVDQMVWSIAEVIRDLSKLYCLGAGDLIFMGTPAGVGPVQPGDQLVAKMTGVPGFEIQFKPDQ